MDNISHHSLLIKQLARDLPTVKIARGLLAIVLIAGLIPRGALWFESSMTLHMLVQFPLLIVLGAASFQPGSGFTAMLGKIDPLGIIAFIFFTGWMWFWMLPLNLDLATIDTSARLLKLISVPIGIGFCFRWLWHQTNALFKCMVIFEIWASITRLGWLYLESPLQLCSSYLIGEQQQVGALLLQVSAIAAIIAVLYSMLGSFTKDIDCKLAKQ